MLKFIKGHVASIAGIEIFPLISLLIFFFFFVLLFIWVFTMKKQRIEQLAQIPIENKDGSDDQ